MSPPHPALRERDGGERVPGRLKERPVLVDVAGVGSIETTRRSPVERLERARPRRLRSREPTAREAEVLQLVADGFGSAEIARRLWVSEETVKTHVTHVLDRLGAKSRANAVAIAMRRGLIE